MTVVEFLVSACITVLVAGAALSAVAPLQRAFAAQPEAASLTQRARVVSEVLSGDLRQASLLLPIRIGDVDDDPARGVFYRSDVVTVLTDPMEALARGLVAPSTSRTYHRKRDGEGVWQLMQYDGHASDQPAVEDVVDLAFEYFGEANPPAAVVTQRGRTRATYGPAPPAAGIDDPGDSWGAGENCTFANNGGGHVTRLQALGAPGIVPIPPAILTDGPWCPDAAHAFRFDADLLRVRSVRVRIRLQATAPFRGAAGPWFLNSGSAGDSARYVRDEIVFLEIAPRNVHVAR